MPLITTVFDEQPLALPGSAKKESTNFSWIGE